MTARVLEGKSVLITGGTGSLGKVLLNRILSGELGFPKKVIIFSRDEGKQHAMRLENLNKKKSATHEVIYENFNRLIQFVIGNVRDYDAIADVVAKSDIVINTAAMKQVPTCEYFPFQAVQTNIIGAQNIVKAVRANPHIESVVAISTDKACLPINVMGMTKAIQERIFLSANIDCPDTRFFGVRYGNVLASRGSVIPLFHEQIRCGGPVTITDEGMTRFLLSLNQAVDIIFEGLQHALPGEIYVPVIPSAKVTDIAKALIGKRDVEVKVTGIRPGEKLHEVMISEEEARRTFCRGDYYVLSSILSEISSANPEEASNVKFLSKTYDSSQNNMSLEEVCELMSSNDLLLSDDNKSVEMNFSEMLR